MTYSECIYVLSQFLLIHNLSDCYSLTTIQKLSRVFEFHL